MNIMPTTLRLFFKIGLGYRSVKDNTKIINANTQKNEIIIKPVLFIKILYKIGQQYL